MQNDIRKCKTTSKNRKSVPISGYSLQPVSKIWSSHYRISRKNDRRKPKFGQYVYIWTQDTCYNNKKWAYNHQFWTRGAGWVKNYIFSPEKISKHKYIQDSYKNFLLIIFRPGFLDEVGGRVSQPKMIVGSPKVRASCSCRPSCLYKPPLYLLEVVKVHPSY